MLTSELDYELPEALIAQAPAEPRDSSRLMVVDVKERSIAHHVFRDLPRLLRRGDVIVINDTKVLPARLVARKESGGEVELLFLRELDGPWEVLARPSKRLKPGITLAVGADELEVIKSLGEGHWIVEGRDVRGTMERNGRMPLPPYIRPSAEAERAYQTVYARAPGSAAAPTAGFHFTKEVLSEVERAGAGIARATLHVGTGTFAPIRAEKLQEHRMHTEHYSVPEGTIRTLEGAERVLAAGTTVARTLETWAMSGHREGESRLFVYPGYEWRVVDVLLTNFHLPRSTLLAMVMSFGGKDLVREAYRAAVEERYRFYSFGDAMLLVGGGRNL